MSAGGEWTLTRLRTWTMLNSDVSSFEHRTALVAYILADVATRQRQAADCTACDLLQFLGLGALHCQSVSTRAGILNRCIARGVVNVLRLVTLQILDLFSLLACSRCFITMTGHKSVTVSGGGRRGPAPSYVLVQHSQLTCPHGSSTSGISTVHFETHFSKHGRGRACSSQPLTAF